MRLSSCRIASGLFVMPEPAENNGVQRTVQMPVTATIETVARGLTG